jgi:tellurite methyltransferase
VSPSSFVLEHLALAPPGRALDVATGGGRHAVALAQHGWTVEAIDRDWASCLKLAEAARSTGLAIRVVCADLTGLPLPPRRYAVVTNTLYLDRALAPALTRALVPGGLLLFETFTRAQLATGHPRNPAFVLEPSELPTLFPGLQVLTYREGAAERDGRIVHLASLAARAPVDP